MLGIISRPLPQLSLLADFRYLNKDDQTPIALYNNFDVTNPATLRYTNQNLSGKKTNAKLQASWQFNADSCGTFTASSAIGGVSALRQNTVEPVQS